MLMELSMMVQEKVEAYETAYQLKDALDKILTGYDQFEQSSSLEEDIGYLSKKCTGYNQKRIIQLYQFLLDHGYFLDSKFLLVYGESSLKKLLEAIIEKGLKKFYFIANESINDGLVETIAERVLSRKKNFIQSFEKIFINSQGVEIYFRRYDDLDSFLKIFHYLSDEMILEFYEDNLFSQGLTERSIKNYMIDMRVFLRWLEKRNMGYSELDRKTAKIFLTYFLEGRKVASFNKMLTSLSNFNRFLLSINAIDQMVFIHKRDQIKDLNKNVVEVFTPEEQAVIEQVLKENLLPQRIDLAIAILYYTGIRVTELVTIKLENINRVKKELTVMGKGKKQRVVPLKDLVIQKMDKYIKGEREGSKHRRSPYLIVSQRSDKMSREVMTRKLKVLNNYIDCRVYAHKFRHNLATELVKKGVRINVVAEILGHSNIQTTIDYYVNTSVKDKRQAINLI